MKVNVFVNDIPVGSRTGCDVLVDNDSCKKTSVGTPFYHEGLPRDICEMCMAQMIPGKPMPTFNTNHYDFYTERHMTGGPRENDAANLPEPNLPEEPPPPPPPPPPPAFPTCPRCGERTFVITQNIAEVKVFDWDPGSFKFRPVGETAIEQKTHYRCQKCGEEGLAALLTGWII